MPRPKFSTLLLEVAAAGGHADQDLGGVVEGVAGGLDEAAKVKGFVANRKIPRQWTSLVDSTRTNIRLRMQSNTQNTVRY